MSFQSIKESQTACLIFIVLFTESAWSSYQRPRINAIQPAELSECMVSSVVLLLRLSRSSRYSH